MIHKQTGFIVHDKSFSIESTQRRIFNEENVPWKHEACNDRCYTIILKFARGKRKETNIKSKMIGVGGM